MTQSPLDCAVIGAGMLGLTLALRLSQQGHRVTLFEASPELGGQASTWQLGALTWDRHYHVIAQDDHHLIALLQELGIADKLVWRPTRTGFFAGGRLHSLSNVVEFIRFPVITLWQKFRLGLTLLRAKSIKDLRAFEGETSLRWLTRWSGVNVTEKLWSPLLQSKFGEQFSSLSAAFIISNIQRMFGARKGKTKQEVFGYVEGGYHTILSALHQKLVDAGVTLHLNTPVASIVQSGGSVTVTTAKGPQNFDRAAITAAAPLVAHLCPGLTDEEKARFAGIEYLGIVCASLLTEKPLSPYYITNILDRWVPFTGIIEMSALVEKKEFAEHSLVYLPR
ncbi:MAG: FAD-dependent oxidoreductase [Rickettsiales bacterium]|nr:FAD-dependent oxidoreductase [Rickettsiales bacterium]